MKLSLGTIQRIKILSKSSTQALGLSRKLGEMTRNIIVQMDLKPGDIRDQVNQWISHHSFGNQCLLKPGEKRSEKNK